MALEAEQLYMSSWVKFGLISVSMLVTVSPCVIDVITVLLVLLANMVDPSDQVMVDGGDEVAVQLKTALLLKVMVRDDGDTMTRGASREDREEGRKGA